MLAQVPLAVSGMLLALGTLHSNVHMSNPAEDCVGPSWTSALSWLINSN